MSRKFLVPIDLTKQELQNARIQNLASAPSSPVAGQIYFDTTADTMFFWDGDSWVDMQTAPYSYASAGETSDVTITATESEGTSTNLARADHQHSGPGFGNVTSQTSYGASSGNGSASTVARSDHSHGTPALTAVTPQALTVEGTGSVGTGTAPAREDHVHAGPGFGSITSQTAFNATSGNGSAITPARSDHTHGTPAHDAAAHSAIKISDLAAPSADVSFGTYKITSLADPTSAQHAATKNYVDTRKVTDLTAPTSAFSMNSQKITNLSTPTSDYDAANKLYVDQAVQGLTWKESVNLFSATNVPLTGSTGLVIDGHSALDSTDTGYRILLTGQTTDSQNGIYTFSDDGTTYTLARSTDADTHDELIGATVFVKEGTGYGQTSWVQTNHYITDFTGQTWVQFSGAGTYTASNGVVLDVKDFKFAPKTDGGLATGISGGFVKLPTNSGLGTTSNGLAVGAGTGIVVSTGTVAVDVSDANGRVARRYATNIGDTSATTFTITHNLNSLDVIVQVYTVSDGSEVMADVSRTGVNTVSVAVASAPSSNQYRVVVVG
jgi:hypothetical protein